MARVDFEVIYKEEIVLYITPESDAEKYLIYKLADHYTARLCNQTENLLPIEPAIQINQEVK